MLLPPLRAKRTSVNLATATQAEEQTDELCSRVKTKALACQAGPWRSHPARQARALTAPEGSRQSPRSRSLRLRPSVAPPSCLLRSRARRRTRFPETEARLDRASRALHSSLDTSPITLDHSGTELTLQMEQHRLCV